MLREGHLGISMLLYAPLGIVITAFLSLELAVIGGLCTVFGGNLPDFDTSSQLVKHRGFTHTIWFAIITAITMAIAVFLIGTYLSISQYLKFGLIQAIFIGSFTGVGVMTHIAGDLITPRGIKPFHPVSPRNVLPVTVSERKFTFEITNADNKAYNTGFLALGILATTGAIYIVMNYVMFVDM